MKKILITCLFFYPILLIAQFSEEHIITTEAINANFVHAVDLNGDGFIDVVAASIGDNTLAWYENLDGLGNFGDKRVISEFSEEYRFISSADIDGDGDLDILSTALFEDLVVWFENLDGLGNFSNKKIISANRDLPLTVFGADLDNDGDIDVFTSSKNDGVIAWYENTNGLGDFSIEHIITTQAYTTTYASAGDIDNDGNLDILATSSGNNQSIFWYENLDGLGSFGEGNVIISGLFGPNTVIADDLDGDGGMDVVSSEFGGNTIAWYENLDGLGEFGVKNTITTNVDATFQIVVADMDNDGNQDIVLVSGGDNKIAWQKNDGIGNFGEQQIITETAEGPRSLDVADFDGDGYIDVVSASIIDYKIAWYKNLTYLNVNENAIKECFTIYPNPVQNNINIDNNANCALTSIRVFDVFGRKVIEDFKPTNRIDISFLSSGLLFVQLETDEGVITKKVIKE